MGREREIGDLLDGLVSGLRRDMERHAAELAVSGREWPVLDRMHDDSAAGQPSSVEGIWKRVEMSRERVMETLLGLEDRGLVVRNRDGWHLTRDGESRIRPLIAISDSIAMKGISGLSSAELDELAGLLRRMSANLGVDVDAAGGRE